MISNQQQKLDISKQIPTVQDIQEYLVSYLAKLLEIEPDNIKITIPFAQYNLDSVVSVALMGDLEEWLERELNPTLIYDYPTIEALAQHLSTELESHI